MAVKMSFGGASVETPGFKLYMGEALDDDEGNEQYFVVAESIEEAHAQFLAESSIAEGEQYRIWLVEDAKIAGPARALAWHTDVTGGVITTVES